MEGKNLFYCYNSAVAAFLMRRGMVPDSSGVNKRSNAPYWTFKRGPALDEGLDAWQKQRWHTKQTEEAIT